MMRNDTRGWAKRNLRRKKKNLCLRVDAKSLTTQLEVNQGRARLRGARERELKKRKKERKKQSDQE